MNILIDWVSFTLMPSKDSDSAKLFSFAKNGLWEYLRLDGEFSNFTKLRGVNGYYKRYTYNGVTVQYPTVERVGDIGINVMMSGDGCRYVESLIGWQADGGFSWSMFFKRLFALSALYKLNICRLDVAVDDKADRTEDGKLDLDTIHKHALRGDYVSKSRTFNSVVTREGFVKSNIIIYDKATEQAVDGHWVRFEMELKQRNARYIAKHIISEGDNFGRFFASFVSKYLRFVTIDDANISRCSVVDWWANFLGEVDELKIVLGEYVAKTIEKMVDTFTRMWSTNLFCLVETVGADFVIDNIIASGSGRLSKRHVDAINDYKYAYGGDLVAYSS